MTSMQPHWHLPELLDGLVEGVVLPDVVVEDLCLDSRDVAPGVLFFALRGTAEHGVDHLGSAERAGACALLADPAGIDPAQQSGLSQRHTGLIWIDGLRQRVSAIAERFFDYPSRAMRLVGITGTNGKTSVSHYLASALTQRAPCGVIGTLGTGLQGAVEPFGGTTPNAILLSRTLANLRAQGAQSVVMEVSSHGLHQGRVAGIDFDVVVFTNLTHDHLDYHGDMAEYAACKAGLFQHPGVKSAVLNLDDEFGRQLLADLPAGVEAIGYSLAGAADTPLQGRSLRLGLDGLQLSMSYQGEETELQVPLLGRFNAANLLAACGVLLASGYSLAQAADALTAVRGVTGRMQRITGSEQQPLVVVDFAHTPDALEQVLAALREHCSGRLICLFGCGGERDQSKRPLMGALAERLADTLVITDDNPRGEPGEQIIEAILSGLQAPERAHVIRDRAAAITYAINQAGTDDLVLLAGKGHEAYQEVAGERLRFSDVKVAEQVLAEAGRAAHG